MSKYTINVSFQTRVNKTTRTLEIAESFGLGLDEKEWTLYDNLELEVKQGDVVYITGQSGCRSPPSSARQPKRRSNVSGMSHRLTRWLARSCGMTCRKFCRANGFVRKTTPR